MTQDHDKIAHLVKQHWGITLETKEISFKGWNWGAMSVVDASCTSGADCAVELAEVGDASAGIAVGFTRCVRL